MNRLVPIHWCILRERIGTCQACGKERKFKFWLQTAYPFPALECSFCFKELDITGTVKDYFRERRD